MVQLIRPHVVRYPRAAYARYMRVVMAAILAAGTFLKNTLGTLIADFTEWFNRLEALMLWPGMTVINAKLAAADRVLDHALSSLGSGLRDIIRYSADAANVAAAEAVIAMLKHYGSISDKTYEAEAGDIKSILDNLNGAYAAYITALALGDRKGALQAAYDSFIALLAERKAIEMSRPKDSDGNDDTFVKIRRGIEPVLRKIMDVIDSGAELKLSQDFGQFILGLNPETAHMNFEYRRVVYDIFDCEPSPIPDEPFTGEEKTPVPASVLFNKNGRMVRLRLGRHFDVTYKNNINAGNAYCILHGKGGYKGTKPVTFTIRHGVVGQWEDNFQANEQLAINNGQSKDAKRKPAAKAEPLPAAAADAGVSAANEQLAVSNEQLEDVKRKPLTKADEAEAKTEPKTAVNEAEAAKAAAPKADAPEKAKESD